MIPSLGNFCLYLTLIFSLTGCLLSLTKIKIMHLNIICFIIFALIGSSFSCLIYSYITSDFSVLNVYWNSHTQKPFIYKFSGAWGNHEGSMMLWLFALCFYVLAFGLTKHDNNKIKKYTIGIQLLIISIFTIYVVSSSNPFVRVFPAPNEGRGLNAILQDIGLAMHPPVLYMGYVGFSLVYSNAIAVLLAGKNQSEWARYLRPWALLSWTFLTIGISLGSWWAYRELGWGGYWYWDPVENASLMPWLFATALLHSLISTHRNKTLSNQSILLSLLTFTLTMVGTFIVRSGAITSVHSFASDPGRGIFILFIISFLFLFGLFIFSYKQKDFTKLKKFPLLSNSSFILGNNLLLIASGCIVVFGTLYPIFLELCTGISISVGAPYYNQVLSPIALALIILCILGSQIGWKRITWQRLLFSNIAPILLSLLCSLLIFITFDINSIFNKLAIFFSLVLIITILEQNSKNFGRIETKFLGVTLAHIGFGLLILSVSVNSAAKIEHEFILSPGEEMVFKNYKIKFKSLYFVKGKNYIGKRADLSIDDLEYDDKITIVQPEIRFFPAEQQQTIESSSYHYPLYDLYFVMGDEVNKRVQFKVFYQPFIGLLWLSCFLISIGGIFSIAYKVNLRLRI